MARPPKPTRENTPAVPWRPHAVPLLILWSLALAAYANSFRAGLVFDNHFAIAQDARIRQATSANVQLILTKDYWYRSTLSSLYRPLTTLSYLFNYAILGNGVSPAGYHWVNFLLHAVNIGLVYLLGLLLFAEIAPAFAMAALWAVHPVLTESVTNIVGRADLLAAFGVLAGLLCYARSVAPGGRHAIRWRLGLMVATAIGIFSKESGIAVLAAVFLYDVAFCRAIPLRRRIGGYLAMTPAVAGFLAVRAAVLANLPAAEIPFTDNPLVGADFWTARLTAVKVVGKYLGLLIWPAHLSADYSFNQIPLFSWRFNGEDLQAVAALLVCAAAVALAVSCYRRSPPVFFLLAFFFATLAPTANLAMLIGTIMAERFLYLPSVAFAGCLAWVGWMAYRRWPAARRSALPLLAVICLAFAARTFARNRDWLDEQSLWSSAAAASPESYKPHHHLASLYSAPPVQLDGASREIDQALAILKPLPDQWNLPAVYATAGLVYRSQGDALGSNGGTAWYRKALEALLVGQRVDAVWFQALAARNQRAGQTVAPAGWSPLYLELGRTYRSLGEYAQALEAFAHGRTIDPQTQYFEEMALTYRAMGDAGQAAVSLLEGITLGSADQPRLAAEVVELYRQTEPESCALAGGGPSASLNFNCPLVRSQLCLAGRNVVALERQMYRERDAVATQNGAIQSLGCPAEMFR